MAAAHSANESDSIEKAPATSKMQAFLRKARGQIDRPANIESKSTYVSKETAIGSASESDQSLSHEHGSGDVFANGGDSRYYEPIASYEGRHRWDPHAEWTEQEEKKLVRKVCSTSPTPGPPFSQFRALEVCGKYFLVIYSNFNATIHRQD